MSTTARPIVVAIPGSLRAGSYSRLLLRALGTELAPAAHLELTEPIRDLPLYDADLDTEEHLPATARALRETLRTAPAIVIATPDYNAALPGGLKNLVDWATRPMGAHSLVGRPVAVIGCTPGPRGGKASSEYLRTFLPLLGARVVGPELLVPGVDKRLDPSTGAADDELRAQLAEVAAALVAATSEG